jgi:pimeloyl-ACP methyl ester carboxylesterase
VTALLLAPSLTAPPDVAPARRHGVVLVHGMRQSSRTWAAQEAYLAAAGHTVVPVDLPGHGRRIGQRFTLDAAHDVIDDAVESLPSGDPVVVVGQSLGGYTTLGWAARRATSTTHPLAGVVASGCSTDPFGKPVALYRGAADRVARAAASWRDRLPGRAGQTPRTSPDGSARPGWGLVTDALGALAGRSSLADLADVRVPVWFVNGARCHLRWQEQRYLRTAERGALVVVPRTGHDVQLEAPTVYNRILGRALSDFTRSGPLGGAAHGAGARLGS